ncbi:MAG: hypothetical protein P4L83_18970 [Nevskia sp.]|nr:hypothetical protein [Nevskia sp.]
MSHTAWYLLLLAAAYLGFRLLIGLVVLVQVLRLSLWPARLRRLDRVPELPEDQAAAAAELSSLGFVQVRAAQVDSGPATYTALLFRHPTLPAFAWLSLCPAGNVGYPVGFHTFGADGVQLSTGNRLGWVTFAVPPQVHSVDAGADSLAAHWQAHQARLAGITAAHRSDDEVLECMRGLVEDYLPLLQDRGLCTGGGGVRHPTLRAAVKATLNWLKVRRTLARRYVSPATSGDHQVAYFTRCYAAQEAQLASRPPRHNVKASVLVLSILAALLLWGLAFDWTMAAMLVTIVLVHESGHALAMRLFGYRDMSMFFIPFVGALVTGKPKELPAWKQAVILFAGPVPGLLAGLALLVYGAAGHALPWVFNWQQLAVMAVAVNLFNLLPIAPLDGGQLVDLSLFSRWPRSRLSFSLAGAAAIVALAVQLKSTAMTFAAVAIAAGMRSQFRIMRLQRAWRDGLDHETQIRNLFETAKRSFRVQTYAQQAMLVKVVLTRRLLRGARAWESALVLSVLLLLWGGAGAAALTVWGPAEIRSWALGVRSVSDHRSPAQRAFDTAYDGEDSDDGPDIAALDQLAPRLTKNDPRRVDLAYLHGMRLQEPERATALEALLATRRDGHFNQLDTMEEQWLDNAYEGSTGAAPEARAAALTATIERAMKLVPDGFPGTVDARLKLAELVDRAGDAGKAETMLLELRRRATNADNCRCALRHVVAAQARFDESRHRAPEALTAIESSPFTGELKRYGGDLPLEYAWALLESGRLQEGAEQMRVATVWQPRTSLLQRMMPDRDTRLRSVHALEMAYAWHLAGRDSEIETLEPFSLRAACAMQQGPRAPGEDRGPWLQARETTLGDFARSICPRFENVREHDANT